MAIMRANGPDEVFPGAEGDADLVRQVFVVRGVITRSVMCPWAV